MSEDDCLFAVAPLGVAHVLIAAERIREIAPVSRAIASEWPCVDLDIELGLETRTERQALLVGEGEGVAWLLVGRGTRFERVTRRSLRPLPIWLVRARAPLRALAPISVDGRFGFELNVDHFLDRSRREIDAGIP